MKYLKYQKEILDVAKSLLYLELQPNEQFGWMIVNHPFTQSNVAYVDDKFLDLSIKENANKWRKQMLKLFDGEDFFHLAMFVCNPYKLTFLKFCKPYLDNDDIAKFFSDYWRLVEYPSHDANVSTYQLTKMLLKCKKEILMDEDELEVYNNLPQKLTVYRGVPNIKKNNKHALSWTLNKAIAKKFCAHGIPDNPTVLTKEIDRSEIICYFENEEEVLLNTY